MVEGTRLSWEKGKALLFYLLGNAKKTALELRACVCTRGKINFLMVVVVMMIRSGWGSAGTQ